MISNCCYLFIDGRQLKQSLQDVYKDAVLGSGSFRRALVGWTRLTPECFAGIPDCAALHCVAHLLRLVAVIRKHQGERESWVVQAWARFASMSLASTAQGFLEAESLHSGG